MTPTAKGALLTAGIGFLTVGVTLVSTNWQAAIFIAIAGAGLIFLREFLKEV